MLILFSDPVLGKQNDLKTLATFKTAPRSVEERDMSRKIIK